MKSEKNLPALDDVELRKKQFIRYTEGLGDLGDYAKELKKTTKINMWIGIIFTGFLAILFIGTMIYQYNHGGISSIIDEAYVVRRFNCTSGNYTDTLRTYEDVERFLRIYGGECVLYKES